MHIISGNGLKHSLYLFLSALLGFFLFFLLHRIVIFLSLVIMVGLGGNSYFGLSLRQFLFFDYVSLLIVLCLGVWYGIWIGSYWYEKIYIQKVHAGAIGHLASVCWPQRNNQELKAKIDSVATHLKKDLWQLEDLEKSLSKNTMVAPKPIKRRMVRRKLKTKI